MRRSVLEAGYWASACAAAVGVWALLAARYVHASLFPARCPYRGTLCEILALRGSVARGAARGPLADVSCVDVCAAVRISRQTLCACLRAARFPCFAIILCLPFEPDDVRHALSAFALAAGGARSN